MKRKYIYKQFSRSTINKFGSFGFGNKFGLYGLGNKKSNIRDYDYSKFPTDKIYNRNVHNYFFKDLNNVKISPIQKSIIEYQSLASDLGHISLEEINESISQGRYTIEGAKKGAVLVGDTEFIKVLDSKSNSLASKWASIGGGADKSYDRVIDFIQKNEKEFTPLERIETQYNKDMSTYKMRYFSKQYTDEQLFLKAIEKMAKKKGIENYFIVTDGASITKNNGNPAVRNARMKQIAWEKRNGFDPKHDWS